MELMDLLLITQMVQSFPNKLRKKKYIDFSGTTVLINWKLTIIKAVRIYWQYIMHWLIVLR